MFRRVCVIFASASLALSGATASGEPLQPVRKWDLNYGDTECLAFRDYADAANPTTLAIRQSPNGETYEMLVVRKGRAPQDAEELQGSVDFGQGPIKAWLLHYQPTGSKLDLYQFRIPAADMVQARSAATVTFHIEGRPDIGFGLASMPQLLDGLRACTTDLARYWNADGEKNGTIATAARGDVRSAFSSDDYPAEALDRRQEGATQFLLLIDDKGKVAGCQVLLASGVPALDAMGCIAIQKRARFTPARDSKGKPVRSMVVTPKVKWQLAG